MSIEGFFTCLDPIARRISSSLGKVYEKLPIAAGRAYEIAGYATAIIGVVSCPVLFPDYTSLGWYISLPSLVISLVSFGITGCLGNDLEAVLKAGVDEMALDYIRRLTPQELREGGSRWLRKAIALQCNESALALIDRLPTVKLIGSAEAVRTIDLAIFAGNYKVVRAIIKRLPKDRLKAFLDLVLLVNSPEIAHLIRQRLAPPARDRGCRCIKR
jgi:hypothetical protein